jgi:Zn-dependent membrane protease YugP
MIALRESGHFSNDELSSSRKVLTAAAMTYVAALAVSAMQLLRLFLIVRNNDRRN